MTTGRIETCEALADDCLALILLRCVLAVASVSGWSARHARQVADHNNTEEDLQETKDLQKTKDHDCSIINYQICTVLHVHKLNRATIQQVCPVFRCLSNMKSTWYTW
jgi:hypothetical protein